MYLFIYSAVQEIGKFRADRLFSHQTLVKWPLVVHPHLNLQKTAFRYFDNFYEAKVLIAFNNINYAYLAADHSLFMVLDTLVDISSLLN